MSVLSTLASMPTVLNALPLASVPIRDMGPFHFWEQPDRLAGWLRTLSIFLCFESPGICMQCL